jgi:hypothetical protein
MAYPLLFSIFMKFKILLIIGSALISLNGVAQTTHSIPTDAGAHLLKRLGLKEDFEGTYYFVGKTFGGNCYVDAEVSWEGDDNLRFVITVTNPLKLKISHYQGRFGKDSTDAVKFFESKEKLEVASRSSELGFQTSNLEILSAPDGSIKNIYVGRHNDSLLGRLITSGLDCSQLKPIVREKPNDQSRENETNESSVWSLSSVREFFRQMSERMEPKYIP